MMLFLVNEYLRFILCFYRYVSSCLHLFMTHLKTITSTFPLATFPDKATNITVTYNVTSRSAKISWLDPKNRGIYGLSNFWIIINKDGCLILNITTKKVNEYEINNLTPYTTYEISIAAGSYLGFGEKSITSFLTSEEGEC